MPEVVDPPPAEDSNDALFTVVAGEGDGFMLGLAAGDTAGGAWELGYSAVTEQATVFAYQLITRGELDRQGLVEALLELDGVHDEEAVYRAESPEFRMWLDRARAASPVAGVEPSLDAAARSLPLGVTFRRDVDALIDQSIELGRIFHSDTATIVGGVIAAAAVAASCFAQSGLDLIAGVAETLDRALTRLELEGAEAAETKGLPDRISGLTPSVGIVDAREALEAVGDLASDLSRTILAGLLLAAPVVPRHHLPIEQAARIGGSRLGAMVGAIVGARVGIRAWPWAFANDTWFAEIGRRMVRGPSEIRDLPIPYAVEQHLMSGGRPGFH